MSAVFILPNATDETSNEKRIANFFIKNLLVKNSFVVECVLTVIKKEDNFILISKRLSGVED